MEKPRVLITRRWPEEVERQLAERFDATFREGDTPLGRAGLMAAMDDYDVLCPTVSDPLDAEVIAGGANGHMRVKLIANYGVGFDHIDLAAAKANGIAVTNTPGVLTDATADLAMTLLLMVARRAGQGERELRAGRWRGWRPTHLIGSSLQGKVLGLVGFGRIGIATARRAHHGFGMKIAYYGRREALPDVVRELDARFYPELDDLLAASDFVSLHVPGGAGTQGLIGTEALAAMKPGSYLVNTARGGVIDHAALAAALRSGHLAGAGLDVYPAEPQVPEELLEIEDVVLLPHLGSATREARVAMGERALANVVAWAEGRPLPDRIA
jgi:lactate dehydrogenase-like 2-hydroxyacid dehydrogenase